jgi:hypothetical protein
MTTIWTVEPKRQLMFKENDDPSQIVMPEWTVIEGMQVCLSLDTPKIIHIAGHVGFQNDGPKEWETTGGGYSEVMWALKLLLNGKTIPGTMRTGNFNRIEHYEDVNFAKILQLPAGNAKIEVVAKKRHFDQRVFKVHVKAPQYCGMDVLVQNGWDGT